MKNYWSSYWKRGCLTSFADDIEHNYEGVIKSCWLKFFSSLNDKDKVLDIGSGNGALIELAISTTKNSLSDFVGIDSAELNVTDQNLNGDRVAFYEKCNAESLSFSDDSFSKAMAQFSIEYTNLEKSIAELSRVLKKQGAFQFVCHCDDSIIVKPNKKILLVAEKIIQKKGLLDTTKQLKKSLEKSNFSTTKNTEMYREQLNKTIHSFIVEDEASFLATDYLNFLKPYLGTKDACKSRQMMEAFESGLNSLVFRLTDLINASLSKGRAKDLDKILKQNQLQVDKFELLKQNDQIIGYLVKGVNMKTKANTL